MIAFWTEKSASVLDKSIYAKLYHVRSQRRCCSLITFNEWKEGLALPSLKTGLGQAQVPGVRPIHNIKLSRRWLKILTKTLTPPLDCFCFSNSLESTQDLTETLQTSYKFQLPWPRPPATREHPELSKVAA